MSAPARGLRGRTLLVPSMHPTGSAFVAAAFRAVGVPAVVMETGAGMEIGRQHTSGKECYPCQVTLGDVLHHLHRERDRLGAAFASRDYAYFLPSADGPCRFGMYTTFQRLVLDRFEDLRDVSLVSLTTSDSYSAGGLLDPKDAAAFRLMVYQSFLAADCLDHILWRARPYERAPGSADALHARAVAGLVGEIERGGLRRDFTVFRERVAAAAREARALIDDAAPRRPRIGVIGEIYLRCHPGSNEGLLRELERHGAEVVNASIAEWITFITWERLRDERRACGRSLRLLRPRAFARALRGWLGHDVEYRYLDRCRRRMYAAAEEHLDVVRDHGVHEIARKLDGERHYSFDVGTEAVLGIGGALELEAHGCDGIVNVYPFTCMPGTIATAVLSPLLAGRQVPYLEVPCDGTHRPNRETAIRTFVWQAAQRREHREAAGAGG